MVIGGLDLCIHKQFSNELFNSGSLWASMCAPLCIAIMAYMAHLNSEWQVYLLLLYKNGFHHSISPQGNIFAFYWNNKSNKLRKELRLLNEIMVGNLCFCFHNFPSFDPKCTNRFSVYFFLTFLCTQVVILL